MNTEDNASIRNLIGSLYADKVSLGDFQSALLNAAAHTEPGGPTPAKDQKMQDLIYNYLQVNKDKLTAEQLGSFSAILSWICVGREVSKFLALVPNASLEDLITTAEASGISLVISD